MVPDVCKMTSFVGVRYEGNSLSSEVIELMPTDEKSLGLVQHAVDRSFLQYHLAVNTDIK